MIVLRSDDEIARIRTAGKIIAQAFERLKKIVRPGVTTLELDEIARDEIVRGGAYPAFKGYKGFPANICTSINEVVVHGIPSSRRLKPGDIISIDVGAGFEGYFADAAITLGVGEIDAEAKRLLEVTEEALYAGIANARLGKRLFDISNAIQDVVESNGFAVVRAFVGHGIGTQIHADPEIPNYGKPDRGPRLDKGMVLALEPMVNAGTFDVEVLDDGWAVVTKDRKLSAHFEHTIAIKEDAAEILTTL